MPIEAYTISEQDGTHIPLSTGDAPTRGTGVQDAAAPAQTDAPADTGASAPPQASPPPDSGLAAPDAGEGETDLDEAADLTPEEFAASRRRINQLNGRWRAEQRRREADRQAAVERLAQQQGQIEALTRLLQGAAPDLPQTPAHPAGPPQAEQYTDHDTYLTAKARYEAEQLLRERDQQQQAQRQQEQQRVYQQQLIEREQAFLASHPDFHEVVSTGLRGRLAAHVQQALGMLPDGPAVAYQLARQPEVVQHLNTLPPPLVFAELGRLMPGPLVPGATGSAPAQTPPAPSNGQAPAPPLPEPMRPVGGSGSAVPAAYKDDMTMDEYRAWRARTSQNPRWRTG